MGGRDGGREEGRDGGRGNVCASSHLAHRGICLKYFRNGEGSAKTRLTLQTEGVVSGASFVVLILQERESEGKNVIWGL